MGNKGNVKASVMNAVARSDGEKVSPKDLTSLAVKPHHVSSQKNTRESGVFAKRPSGPVVVDGYSFLASTFGKRRHKRGWASM